jgi:ribonuclease HII
MASGARFPESADWQSPADGEAFVRKRFNTSFIVGIDEAGRGPLAGPVTAAAVILPENYDLPGISDSKKLSAKKREALFAPIQEQAVAWAIADATPQEIDEINILQATFLAMRRALDEVLQQINEENWFVIVDGNHNIAGVDTSKQHPLIKGDALVASVAAASVLAKVSRDRKMEALDKLYPQYAFKQHKGYPSKQHIDALREYGYSSVHRKSFQVKALMQTKLDL